jgi:hypothetical protein
MSLVLFLSKRGVKMKINEVWMGDIYKAIQKSKEMSAECQDTVQFEFNGVTVRVDETSDNELVYRDWQRGMSGYLGKDPIVGPEYAAVLTADEIASDANIETQNEARREESRLQAEAEDRIRKLLLRELLADSGPLSVNDQAAWDALVELNSTDSYSKAAMDYAIQWGRLMQSRIASGEKLVDIAQETSHQADAEGITGFMYGCAVNALSKFWIHGEELRKWHG